MTNDQKRIQAIRARAQELAKYCIQGSKFDRLIRSDIPWLIEKAQEPARLPASIQEALNSGDGSYKP